MIFCPYEPNSPYPRSSAKSKIILGLFCEILFLLESKKCVLMISKIIDSIKILIIKYLFIIR